MLLFSIVVYFTIIINALLCIPIEQDSMPSIDESIASTSETKQKLTLDEFFDYTTFLHMSFSPNGQYLLYATKRPSPVTEYHAYGLWLYNIQTMETTQITKYLEPNVNPQWSPSSNFITYVSYDKYVSHTANNLPGAFGSRANSPDQFKHGFSVYSIELRIIIFIPVAYSIPTIVTWSQNASTIYVLQNIELNRANLKGELKQSDKESKLYSVRLSGTNGGITYTINILQTIPLHVRELLFVPSEDKFIFISKELTNKNVETNEIYSLDLKDNSIINRLTNDEDDDRMLQLSSDGKTVFFTVNIDQNDDNDAVIQELYALHVKNGTIRRVGKKSELHIIDYTAKVDGGVYVLGQWRTQIQVYSVQSIDGEWVRHDGIPGSYTSVASSSNPNCALAFVYSSSQRPMEIYCAQDVKNLVSARQITNENKLFTERHLPETIVYNWTSKNDGKTIEGILHYPPGQFQSKNLPLLILIHGGPLDASVDKIEPFQSHWALFAATEGWLVFEPNYRGSSGYGYDFTGGMIGRPHHVAGTDILSGMDQLIADGIVDPSRLAVGGCSFGGPLTNWLITQRNDFKAALSCSGIVDQATDWGYTDDPTFYSTYFNGTPWELASTYQNESPLYQLNKIRTPTHISTGALDKRVPAFQSYILERGLRTLGVPVQLLTFPNEGHSYYSVENIKKQIRDELKWLNKFVLQLEDEI
ncbi:unnamed protein product [Adineta ricciae]|uniref:Peptidase S9 prolyl oligopeptidase catalytic domain-containing protein n=1 Tax=Adineta ricciae TaxID=249248 RepID=A0A813SBG8_ADIRI|nr:unnamed protein product [Adineta ricciae]